MKPFVGLAMALPLFVLFGEPALAQSEDLPFDGPYVSAAVGGAFQGSDSRSRILFDRNLDGVFGDTVTNAAGADAFSPGFCGGAARTNAPVGGCRKDKDGVDFALRAGYDKQFGRLVVGGLLEFGKADLRDSVSAFSTTPASYTLTRKLKYNGRLAARAGYAFGNTLLYGTGGLSFARVKNSFATTNVVNVFTGNGNSGSIGYNLGGGVQRKISSRISLGVEYLYTDLKDDDFRKRVGPGPMTPPTNAFIQGNPAGTDFARSDDRFRFQSVRATLTYGF
jgi:outer membrane immunogenic protein